MTYANKTMKSPIGKLKLIASDNGLKAILWENDDPNRVRLNPGLEDNHHPILLEAEHQLNDYFAKKRTTFSIPLDFTGTEFQKKVWNELIGIPFGKTVSYLELSRRLGDPKAIRAVASANGKNNIAIVIPCHRVIGSKNDLVGYGGGIWRKKWLLDHEAKIAHGVQTLF